MRVHKSGAKRGFSNTIKFGGRIDLGILIGRNRPRITNNRDIIPSTGHIHKVFLFFNKKLRLAKKFLQKIKKKFLTAHLPAVPTDKYFSYKSKFNSEAVLVGLVFALV